MQEKSLRICKQCKDKSYEESCEKCGEKTYLSPYIKICYDEIDNSIILDIGSNEEDCLITSDIILSYINLDNQDIYEMIVEALESNKMFEELSFIKEHKLNTQYNSKKPVIEPLNSFRGIILKEDEE